MKSIVEASRDVVREREGDFLTVLVGNPSLYMIPNSAMAVVLVDAFAAKEPQAFVEAVGQYLFENVEVA
jgi:hypothetical protein